MGLPKKPQDKYQIMAGEVHGYVISVNMTSYQKLQALFSRLGKEEIKKLELNYTHQTGENAIERLDARLLRNRIRRLWFAGYKDKAEKLLQILESKNPIEPKPSSTLGGLGDGQRKNGIMIAQRIKSWPPGWVNPDMLGQWLFNEKVWRTLCNAGMGGGIGYTEHTIGGVYTAWFFRVPNNDELKKWESGGAEMYLRQIAMLIDKQLTLFSKEIGWFMAGRGTVMAGDGVLSGLKGKIRAYQKSLEKIGEATQTLDHLKNKLLLPKSSFMKYLWSETTRNELRLWKESKVG